MLLFRCLYQSSEAKHLSLISGIPKIQVSLKLYTTANLILSLPFFFPFCICLTLSLTVNDINYYFWGFFIESHKSVLSSWHALHDSNYIKVIKQNSVPCCQTHVFILLLIKSKPKGKSKMDQNLPFLFKNFIIEHTNDNLLNRNDDVEMHNKI